MDESDSINVLENVLRDLIERLLGSADGDDAADRLGVTDERLLEWRRRREKEAKLRVGAGVEQRLLYFSDFTDLGKIIGNKWEKGFKDCFGDEKRFTIYMERLSAFRNPDAHSRPLMPHEEHLVRGMSGELRQAVTLFISKGGAGTEPEYFARIEEVRDSFGTRVTGGASGGRGGSPQTILRPGDVVSFFGKAWDPEGAIIEWIIHLVNQAANAVSIKGTDVTWDWHVTEQDIADPAYVVFRIRSERPYSRDDPYDDAADMGYRVLPAIHRPANP